MTAVQKAENAAEQARREQVAAWQRWQRTDTPEDQANWETAVDRQRAAEEAVEVARDRAEAWADRRDAWAEQQRERQPDWWVAAMANARAA